MPPGLFAFMRRNPKTSIFLVPTVSASIWYYYDYTLTNDVMRGSCMRAASIGDLRLNPDSRVRHITVILNPVAGKRKTKKLYTKWVEPLLHLAGIKVSLVETESPNQAYDLMKIMSNCDGVAIVGGDGTVHEAMNGLLDRPDRSKASRDFPIRIMPTGQNNSIAQYLYRNLKYRNQKEFLIQSTLRLVDPSMQNYDALKIVPLDDKVEEEEKKVYVPRDLRYAKYQDNLIYQTYIKPIWLRLKRSFSSSSNKNDNNNNSSSSSIINNNNINNDDDSSNSMPPKSQLKSIAYLDPCVRCLRRYAQPIKAAEQSANRRWWSMFAPKRGPSEGEKQEIELAKRDNLECECVFTGQYSSAPTGRVYSTAPAVVAAHALAAPAIAAPIAGALTDAWIRR